MATPIAIRTAGEGRESAFMPTRAERILCFRDAGRAAVSHVRFLGGAVADPSTGDLHADIDVTDEQGGLVARVERICFHLLEHAIGAPRASSELIYRVTWEDASPPAAEAARARRWLVFADDGGVAAAAVGLLPSAHAVHRIYPASSFRREGDDFYLRPHEPEDHRALLQSLHQVSPGSRGAAPPFGVLYLWNLRLPAGAATSVAHLREMARLGCLGITHLLKALDELVLAAPPRVWIATCGAWASSETDQDLAPAQASVWGLTRAIAQEYPALWGGIVDLDPREDPRLQAERLATELGVPTPDEDRIAYRHGRRRVSRLVRDPDAGDPAAAAFRGDRGYLITGGLGALGTRLAAWMIGRGARHLILLGRTPLPPRRTWTQDAHDPPTRSRIDAVLHLERLGAHVLTPALDIGDATALSGFLEGYEQEARPPIAGVAHLAGTIRPELLGELREDALDAAFQSKVYGAWNLHQVFAGSSLDFFVLFSSASAVLNSPLLGGYAAANAFLDGLAHFRRARGEPAQALDWGFWSEAGMAARDLHFDASRPDPQGMRSFSPETGLEIFGGLLARGCAQSIVMDVDWPRWFETYPDAAASPLLRALRADEKSAATAARSPSPGEAAQPLRDLSPADRRTAVAELVLAELSAVLRMSASKISRTARFGSMGLDSMLSLELRNRLERRTGLTLPGTLVWNYPTLERMSAFLVDKLGEASAGEASAGGGPLEAPAPSRDGGAWEPLPSAEMIALLREMGVIDDNDPVLQDPEALRSLMREAEKFLDS
jgi:acyl transferase domain-containing protein